MRPLFRACTLVIAVGLFPFAQPVMAAAAKMPLSPLAPPSVEPEPEDVVPIPRIKVVPRAGMCIGPAIPVGPRTGYFACPEDNLNRIEPPDPADPDTLPSSIDAGFSV